MRVQIHQLRDQIHELRVCFELGIFTFNPYVYYLTCGFIASTRASNLPTRSFNLPARGFELVTCEFELVTRRFEIATPKFEFVTLAMSYNLNVTNCNSCFNFPHLLV